MAKTPVKGLGSVGILYDADPAEMPLNALTDALNVRFPGREIEQCLGNRPEPYYTAGIPAPAQLIQAGRPDAMSNGANVLYLVTGGDATGLPGGFSFWQQGLDTPMLTNQGFQPWADLAAWRMYKGQINGSPFFGAEDYAPVGKQYDWSAFDTLPGWGEQTGGDQLVVIRAWSCKNLIAFGNRLLMLNTLEENGSGILIPYPSRIRWSGFTQSGAFPINWDDTAANRPPDEYAAAVIDGYAGWTDFASESPLVDACDNGGTLFVYSERETFSMAPSGNANSPFIIKKVYSDLGCQDLGCVVNAKGYNYVFTGNDFVRHDSVRWESLAEGVVRDWLAEVVSNPLPGAVRLVNYPELNEIWVMTKGQDQELEECAKTQCLTYNYISGTWSRKALPFVNDVAFAPLAPSAEEADDQWDKATGTWDTDAAEWGGAGMKMAQGTLIGACAAGGVYYLNTGYKEFRHTYVGGVWAMREQDLHCFIERRGVDLADGQRQFITKTELHGRGTAALKISIAGAESTEAAYTWDAQDLQSLVDERRQTWLTEGAIHGYRMEFYGKGAIPSGLTIHHEASGE